jgi:hypothetical protein
MSYEHYRIVHRIYSFHCDHPSCAADDRHDIPATNLPDAHSQLRTYGWAVTGRGQDRRHFCRKHREPDVTQEEGKK